VPPREMLRELMEDNKHVAAAMRKAHKLCDDHEDSGTAGLLETFIDETERAPGSCSKPAARKVLTRPRVCWDLGFSSGLVVIQAVDGPIRFD